MPNYKKMYKSLFNAVTEAIEILQNAQIEAEEEYINSSENDSNRLVELKLINKKEDSKDTQNYIEKTTDKI